MLISFLPVTGGQGQIVSLRIVRQKSRPLSMIIITKAAKSKVKMEEADPTWSKNWLFLVTNPLKLYGFFLVCFHLGTANQ